MSVGRRHIITIAQKVAWAPIAVLIGHAVFAGLYGHEPYVDPVMHFAGGMAAAYSFRFATSIMKEVFGVPTELGSDVMSFGLTCAAALVWETGEFCSDTFLGTNVQKDNANTMRDLILGAAGAIAFIAARRLFKTSARDAYGRA